MPKQNSSQALIADITRLQREIFALRGAHDVPETAQQLMDSARETLHAAKRSVELEAANDQAQARRASGVDCK